MRPIENKDTGRWENIHITNYRNIKVLSHQIAEIISLIQNKIQLYSVHKKYGLDSSTKIG